MAILNSATYNRDTTRTAERLYTRLSVLVWDIEQWVLRQKANQRWLDSYRYLAGYDESNAPALNRVLDNSENLADAHRIINAWSAHYQRLSFWGRLRAFFNGDRSRHRQLKTLPIEINSIPPIFI